ncbi:MAG: hypothetical protein GYA35_08815, partial [Thermoanaerobaculaceae bacterium]|nr:hypothetical protein [Thermoanaerobaculaceae bacterium]
IYSFSVFLLFLPYFWSITYEPYEKWVVRKFPAKECLFIKDNRIEGNLLHKYEDGGFLENSLYPSCKVYFDGRYFDFLPFYKEYVDAIRGGVKSFLAFSEKYPFEIAVLPYSFIPNYKDPENGLKRSGFIFIFPKKKWAPVFYGPYGAVFLKRTPKNEKVIEKYEYKILFPYDKDFISLSIRKGEIKEEVLKEEIERAFKTDAKFLRE